MNITFSIDEHQALVAVMRSIGLGMVFNSRRDFVAEMKSYFQLFGISCIEDHEYENEEYRNAAESIIKKYYKSK